jgi:hypothetical protein
MGKGNANMRICEVRSTEDVDPLRIPDVRGAWRRLAAGGGLAPGALKLSSGQVSSGALCFLVFFYSL